jgi:Rieske Fe-S protein
MCEAVEEYGNMRAAEAAAEAKAEAEAKVAEAEAKVAEAEAKAAKKAEKEIKAVEEKAEKQQITLIKNLMETMKLTLEQAMNALKIPEEERAALSKSF